MADFAIKLPGSTPADTYLNIPTLMKAIKDSGADVPIVEVGVSGPYTSLRSYVDARTSSQASKECGSTPSLFEVLETFPSLLTSRARKVLMEVT